MIPTVLHSAAVARALHESRLATMPAHAPLIELCRTLAAQLDAAGAEPSTRLTAAYLSALKDLRRAIADVPAERPPGKLAELREIRPVPAPTKKTRRPA